MLLKAVCKNWTPLSMCTRILIILMKPKKEHFWLNSKYFLGVEFLRVFDVSQKGISFKKAIQISYYLYFVNLWK